MYKKLISLSKINMLFISALCLITFIVLSKLSPKRINEEGFYYYFIFKLSISWLIGYVFLAFGLQALLIKEIDLFNKWFIIISLTLFLLFFFLAPIVYLYFVYKIQ